MKPYEFMTGRVGMMQKKEVKVKSLYKALQILESFTVNAPEQGITQISEQMGLYKSNVHNIVDTFVQAGYLEKNPENDKYRLSTKILELGHVISSNISFRKVILPYMQQLADATNETVYLGMPSEAEVLYLDSACPKNQLSTRSMLGVKAPLYCTGLGKAMLAFLPEHYWQAVMERGLRQYTDGTIIEEAALRAEMAATRMRGYAIDDMEHEFGIKCIGMPIRNKKREVVAGLSISGPSLRYNEDKIKEFASQLHQTVQTIEEKI